MTDQMDLFGGSAPPPAPAPRTPPSRDVRSTDPETSRRAADWQDPAPFRADLLRAYYPYRGRTDEELADVTGWDKGTASKRRHRAMQAGMIEVWIDAGSFVLTRCTKQGAVAQVFRLTDEGRRRLEAWEAEER